jgi:hypothetical protein
MKTFYRDLSWGRQLRLGVLGVWDDMVRIGLRPTSAADRDLLNLGTRLHLFNDTMRRWYHVSMTLSACSPFLDAIK